MLMAEHMLKRVNIFSTLLTLKFLLGVIDKCTVASDNELEDWI